MQYERTDLEVDARNALVPLENALAKPKTIAIIGHARPDGDAMGSTLALSHYLNTHGGHTTHVLYPDAWPDYNAWMPGLAESIVHAEHPERTQSVLEQAEVIFCLDFGSLSRIDAMAPLVEAQKGRALIVNIDHHADNAHLQISISAKSLPARPASWSIACSALWIKPIKSTQRRPNCSTPAC